jgi:16S rRNA (guanine527-N7)-methyltransferase
VTLMESMARRVAFLEEAVAELRLGSVEVIRARVGQSEVSSQYDVVTARAVAPLPTLVAWAMPLVAEGGVLLAMKGVSAAAEIEAAAAELGRWRARAEVTTSSVPGSSVTTVVRVVRDPAAGIGWRRRALGEDEGGARD